MGLGKGIRVSGSRKTGSAAEPRGYVGDYLAGFGGKRNHRAPPACARAHVADREEPGYRDKRNKNKGAGPAQALFHRLAPFHPLFADVRGECGPSIISGINRQAGLRGGPQKAVCPVASIQANCPCISANDAFAEDSPGKLLVAVLLQRKKVALADLGYSSDLLKRDTARNPLRSKLLPKSTHLVTSSENHSLRHFHRQVTYGSARLKSTLSPLIIIELGGAGVFCITSICAKLRLKCHSHLWEPPFKGLITPTPSEAANLED